MEFIDKVYFINLEKRIDRLKHIENELQKLQIPKDKIVKVKAFEMPKNGALGCSMSHVWILNDMKTNGYKQCIVFEDDATANFKGNFNDLLTNAFQQLHAASATPYKVFLLGGSCESSDKIHYKKSVANAPNIVSISRITGTHAYIIPSTYVEELLQAFNESVCELQKGKHLSEAALDVKWLKLQAKGGWYMIEPPAFYQLPSFSDILKEKVDYRNIQT